MSREAPVRFCEGVRVRVPCATRRICTASSKEILEEKVLPTVTKFLSERGLELSQEKTKITHIDEGFDFLGFNVRKYKGKLLIKPTKKGINAFLTDIREIIHSCRADKAERLISTLNPKNFRVGQPLSTCRRQEGLLLRRYKHFQSNLEMGKKEAPQQTERMD